MQGKHKTDMADRRVANCPKRLTANEAFDMQRQYISMCAKLGFSVASYLSGANLKFRRTSTLEVTNEKRENHANTP